MFERSLISKFAERYSFETDDNALGAGKRIRRGEFTRENLNAIFEWKTKGRGRSRILKNSNAEIADALRLAHLAKTDRASVAVLSGLNDVLKIRPRKRIFVIEEKLP
jgi:hypothetical protein